MSTAEWIGIAVVIILIALALVALGMNRARTRSRLRELVSRVMADRGYPVGDFERRTADFSVEHGRVLDHYRAAHGIDTHSDSATTEQLREAMVHYRAMSVELLDDLGSGTAGDASREASR